MKKIIFILLVFIFYPFLSHSLMIEVPLNQKVKEAEFIYCGTILKSQSYKKDLGQGNVSVYTLTDLEVDTVLKGTEVNEVTIFTAGGVVDDLDYRLSIAPQFEEGENVCVFLITEQDGTIRTLHHFQGKVLLKNLQEKQALIEKIKLLK